MTSTNKALDFTWSKSCEHALTVNSTKNNIHLLVICRAREMLNVLCREYLWIRNLINMRSTHSLVRAADAELWNEGLDISFMLTSPVALKIKSHSMCGLTPSPVIPEFTVCAAECQVCETHSNILLGKHNLNKATERKSRHHICP